MSDETEAAPPTVKEPCPACDRLRPEVTIVNGACDFCRLEADRAEQAAAHAARAADPSWAGIEGERKRAERTRLLDWSDKMMIEDRPTNKTAWRAYRQALRDLPSTYASPGEVVMPTPPE